MQASKDFLLALALKLEEIQANCIDLDTQHELQELIDKFYEQIV